MENLIIQGPSGMLRLNINDVDFAFGSLGMARIAGSGFRWHRRRATGWRSEVSGKIWRLLSVHLPSRLACFGQALLQTDG
jgi:hypothetical protein